MSETLGRVGRGAGAEPEPGAAAERPVARLIGLLNRPLTSYYLIIGITVLLLASGLSMVLSTLARPRPWTRRQSPFAGFQKQLLGALVGLRLMWLAARASPRLFRAAAYPMIGLAVLGLLLVLVIGVTIARREREIVAPGRRAPDPAVGVRQAGLRAVGRRPAGPQGEAGQLTDWRQLLIPLLPGAAILGHAGACSATTSARTFVLLVIFLALLWVIGSPGRTVHRHARADGVRDGHPDHRRVLRSAADHRLPARRRPTSAAVGWQTTEGTVRAGLGRLVRRRARRRPDEVGAGCRRATTDFIFAIIGEELGPGRHAVRWSLLYGGLAYAGMRIARRVTDTFMRLAAAAVTAWIVVQALVNIGAVHRAAADHRGAAAAGLGGPVLAAGDHGRRSAC